MSAKKRERQEKPEELKKIKSEPTKETNETLPETSYGRLCSVASKLERHPMVIKVLGEKHTGVVSEENKERLKLFVEIREFQVTGTKKTCKKCRRGCEHEWGAIVHFAVASQGKGTCVGYLGRRQSGRE
jgi:hypothetical protein